MSKKIYLFLSTVLIILMVSCNNGTSNDTTVLENGSEKGFKTGVALFSFHRHPFTVAIAMADSAGLKMVEGFSFYKLGPGFNDSTMGRLDEKGVGLMKKMLDDRQMAMPSIYVEGAKDENDWKKYFDLAKALDARYVVCEPDKKDWDMIDSLAGVYKMKIAIHEHSRELSAYWHPDSVLAAVRDHPNFGACADLGHWARSGLDPVACLKKLEGYVFEVHLKDIDEANNPKANDVNPGSGVIDFPAVTKELKRQHFDGIIYSECEHNLDNNLKDVEAAIRYIRELDKN